jgi:hypothetical protein
MRFGFVGPSYTARSSAVADEEAINWFAETLESQGGQAASKSYGGASAQALRSYYGTPGLSIAAPASGGLVRGMLALDLSVPPLSVFDLPTPVFVVFGNTIGILGVNPAFPFIPPYQFISIGTIANDNLPVSIVCNGIQLMIVSAGHAYCLTLATNALTDVTASLVGTPLKCEESDGYFIVTFKNTNKFQMSAILDGNSWPGLQVNEVSVFPENITSIIVNHRELWVMGSRHMQPYQNTGSDNIFDVIPGTLIEKGNLGTFGPCKLDNSVFWIDEDERGGRSAWRAQGYTPQRVSTFAVETDLATYTHANISAMTSYAYQDAGHLFWVLYIPGSSWSWVYDVSEQLWHKRASWNPETSTWGPHNSWNHAYAFGLHLVGSWASGNLYEMSMNYLDDAGSIIRRQRRAPTVSDEMEWIYHAELTVDFETGLGPQPPFTDGGGNPRPPQAMLRWSDNRGKTWSNEQVVGCGFAGEYNTRVVWRRLGRSRYRVYELTVSDPIPWRIVDAYLRLAGS